ncbi:LapA family protein [Grimontia hollisae]|uniref:LapA family protein n=1 Tax=Grimontia hollisae TaxID=673 RepID=UPI000DFB64B0|nr:lipopolysaccharide assembly protein LapA domain-containing protein [Grimontia hollisae]STQ76433.1 Inner membrane protein yciS [Grimontia hollisae]
MKIIGIVLLVLCFLITLALGAQNQEVVNFNYLVAQGEFRLSLLLGVVFGIGFALGWLICGMLYLKARMSAAMLKKQVNKQRQELDKLRMDPVKE